MKLVVRWSLLGCLIFLLAACSSSAYRDRNSDYHQAEAKANPLPKEYKQKDLMPLEETQPLSKPQTKIPRPEAQLSYTEPEQLVQLREETTAANWLLANRSPAEVWPALKDFAEEANLETLVSKPSLGQLVVLTKASQEIEIHLRQGVRQASSEIRFSDNQLLPEVQNFLQDQLQGNKAGVSMQAQSLQTKRQVYLQDRDNRQVLLLELDFARAWAEISNLLEEEAKVRTWLALTDYNRDEGRVYIQYLPKDKRPGGFFSRLFKPTPHLKNFSYQLLLTSYSNELDLVVETSAGVAAPVEVEQEILAWLEHQLR